MSVKYRSFETRDRQPVYRLFRNSVWDYLLRHGQAHPEDKPDIDKYFEQQRDQYLHLEKTAAEDWVAEAENGDILGWARSIERDNHLQLTHFFVDPATQSGGIGRALLQRAFPLQRGEQRSVIATTDTRALSLYLRHDVSMRSMALSFCGKPRNRQLQSDLEVIQARPSPATLEKIVGIDSGVLGYRRPVDLEFFMKQQPTFLFYENRQPVAYAFGCDGYAAGPAAALDPALLPAVLDQIEHSAVHNAAEELWLTIPAAAGAAVDWALAGGYRLDPFYAVLLNKNPTMDLDRFIMTQSSFIW